MSKKPRKRSAKGSGVGYQDRRPITTQVSPWPRNTRAPSKHSSKEKPKSRESLRKKPPKPSPMRKQASRGPVKESKKRSPQGSGVGYQDRRPITTQVSPWPRNASAYALRKPFKYIVNPIVKDKLESEIKTVKASKKKEPILTIVIPIRNRHGTRIRNCLKSIELQTEKNIEITISDYGSKLSNHKKLAKTLEPFDCTLYYCKTKNVWNLSKARNIGIRRASGEYIMSLDADIILEPRVVEAVLSRHRRNLKSLITSKVLDLPKRIKIDEIGLPQGYKMLTETKINKRWGFGALMSANVEWWQRVRGFDERIVVWGAEDDDLRKRAKLDGMKVVELQDMNRVDIKIFHQWHPKAIRTHKNRLGRDIFDKIFCVNLAILKLDETLIRNDKTWGVM